jgi:hypothetical protein
LREAQIVVGTKVQASGFGAGEPENLNNQTIDSGQNFSGINKENSLKSPAVVFGDAVFQCHLSTGYTANWPIPTISNATIHIAQIEAFKSIVQAGIPLENQTQ